MKSFVMDSSPDNDDTYISAPSDEPKRSCVCDICGARLSRPAHLQRHLQRHSENRAATRTFHCQLCGRSFSRKDVYQRHKRSVHDSDQASRRNSRRKSCQRCIRYKLKCSREAPCSSCRNCPEQCFYSSNSTDLEIGPTHGNFAREKFNCDKDGQRSANLYDLVDAVNVLSESAAASPSMHYSATMSSDSVIEHEGERAAPHHSSGMEMDVHTTPDTTTARSTSDGDLIFSGTDTTSVDGMLPTHFGIGMSLHHTSEQGRAESSPHGLRQLLSEDNVQQSHQGADHGAVDACLFDFPLEPWQLDLYGWDTLLGGETEPEGLSPSASLGRLSQDNVALAPTIAQPSFLRNSSSPRDNPNETGEDARRQNEVERRRSTLKDVENKECWPGVLDQGGNEAWPFDYTSNKGFRRIKLPPLKEVLEQTVASRPSIQKSILGDLIKVLSSPQIPSLNDTPALEAMPAVAFLSEFTRVYFAEFHNVFPVIHIPTWRIEKCATHLLAAMACLGATYSTAEGSSEVSTLFAEITQRSLFWTGQQDSSAYRNTAYITASCFHQIYALGTGNRRLYEIADASRGLLVTSLRGLGILSSESSISSAPDSLSLDFKKLKAMSNAELEDAWQTWRDKETAKRMAWTVFEFDCTLSTMTSKKAAFRIAELPSRLPCSESIWEAHSARAWAALVPFAASPPAGLLFYPTLREVITSGNVPPHAPAWAVRLCAVAIGRILYDLKEVQDASAPGVLGMPSMTEAHHETRQNLLGSLSALAASLKKPTCTADVVNMNILSLTHHRSHLISSGDETMDLVISIFRNSGHEANHPSVRAAEAAKDRLRHIFRANPVSTRWMVFHAAVIVAIARDCPINTPGETLSVFMGYAFLLAYIRFATFETNDRGHGSVNGVRLDEIPWMRESQAATEVDRWIELGGPATIGSIPNICDRGSFDEAKQGALEALADLGVWGLARKFRQTVTKFV